MEIKWIGFDLDDTLFNGTLLVEKARQASIRMMIEYGLPVPEKYAIRLLNEIVIEFGTNSENHLDNLMLRLKNESTFPISSEINVNKLVAAGVMGYHREKVKHFKLFKDVIKTLEKLRELKIKTAIITDGSPKKQYEKILRLKLENLVDEIIISDEVAVRKPNPNLFSYFLQKYNCKPNEFIYVGDRLERDIEPANKSGIISVLVHRGTKYDPKKTKIRSNIKPKYHINSLYELFSIIKMEESEESEQSKN
ncbi:MAG: TIGR02253 family HAD-type hydrolase [Promethearchaeota archaeon]